MIQKPALRVVAMLLGPLVVLVGACLVPSSLDAACCYFAAKDKDINQPGQKAFITWNPDEKIEAFTVQPKFEGNALDFGMVIPTPSQPKLDEMPRDFFKDLAIYTILMPLPDGVYSMVGVNAFAASPFAVANDNKVRVLESGVVGSLDYKIITAEDANGLFDWLKSNQYSYAGDTKTLDHYIQKKWTFTVMKIDSKQMKKADDGTFLGEVTPTRFTFKTDACIYPLRITKLSVKDRTDALFYVHAPQQMDLKSDLSWQHSYRVMYLTYMLGCAANPEQEKELEQRNKFIETLRARDADFETTKLEWAKKLSGADIELLNDPLKHFAQVGGDDLPPGAKFVEHKDMLSEIEETMRLRDAEKKLEKTDKERLKDIKKKYTSEKGLMVKLNPKNQTNNFGFPFSFYPNREAPKDEVKGLARLKGHLQKGLWLTKFRKVIRKDEMNDDLELVAVPKEQEQTYVRIMPTSPP